MIRVFLFVGLVFLAGCAAREEVRKTTHAIGEVSNAIAETRDFNAPAGTTLEVAPASKAEDGQVRLKF